MKVETAHKVQGNVMHGLMMNSPLLISNLIRHADRHHGEVEVVSNLSGGGTHHYTYKNAHRRARKVANALVTLGCKSADRIATLAWNSYRHFELYYGVSGSGMIMHTVNPRLHADQIAWIINDAEDTMLFVDACAIELAETIVPQCTRLKHVVLMGDRSHMPKDTALTKLLCYEDLLQDASDDFEWPEFDENTASGLCYTSGTTGHPKGSLYSHRSAVLHSYATALPDSMNISVRDCIAPVVPMFHVMAWGIPYTAALTGCKLVLPGNELDGKSLYELFEREKVTVTAGVPTVWLNLLKYMNENKLKLSTLKRVIIGGASCPAKIISSFDEDYGVTVNHVWGMTELSPLASVCHLDRKHDDFIDKQKHTVQAKQGRAVPGIDWRIVDAEGKELPWDGKSSGELHVRGPWVIERYFNNEKSPLIDGWFPTGDVATIDEDGYMQVTDRSKDVIKSGGEWISSIELENIAMSHPAVDEAAVIAIKHPKWDERPLLVVKKAGGGDVSKEQLLSHFEGKIAKWSIPDDVAFVDELPHTATGKLQKLTLREQFKDYKLPSGN